MQLTPQGLNAAKLKTDAKRALGDRLIRGQENIVQYTTGICYDTVAFVRYLKGEKISLPELKATSGQEWRKKFRFELATRQWNGKVNIDLGTAVGFYRVVDQNVFHAALAVGGTSIRGVNGGLLGAGWLLAPDLTKVLGDPNPDGTFNYDRTRIRVYLSDL